MRYGVLYIISVILLLFFCLLFHCNLSLFDSQVVIVGLRHVLFKASCPRSFMFKDYINLIEYSYTIYDGVGYQLLLYHFLLLRIVLRIANGVDDCSEILLQLGNSWVILASKFYTSAARLHFRNCITYKPISSI